MTVFRRFAAFLLAVLTVFALASCGADKRAADTRVVAVANGKYDVSVDLYRYFYLNYASGYADEDFAADKRAATEAEIKASCLAALKNVFGSVAACEKYGVTLDDSVVVTAAEQAVREAKESFGSDREFAAALEENYMNDAIFLFMMKIDAAEDKLFNELILQGVIDNTDETVMAAIKGKDFVRITQVLIAVNNGFPADKNRETAEKVLELAKSGSDFDKLIANYSNDYSMTPDGYYFTRGYMLKEIEDAAFALEIGEVSDIIETKNGYHILKRLAKDDAYMVKNYSALKTQYESCLFYSIIDEISARVTVTENELLATMTYENLK